MPFDRSFNIAENEQLRIPQREGWQRISAHYSADDAVNEVGIVLPVGCGKSGLISLSPYAVAATRALVIAPGTRIRDQLANDMRANSAQNFYDRFGVLSADAEFPEVAVVQSGRTNMDDIRHADVVVANIQQIAGEDNRWLDELSNDFFDLILVDEAHHNTAESWRQVKRRFPAARIINFSATPARADGDLMEGQVIYSFPVLRAIEAGYVKRLRAKMLRPETLRYIDREQGERVIDAEEARRLGETNAEFRRGIVMSDETLASIVQQSIHELRRLREETGEQRLKIIASAINYDHCIQIKEAFRARGLRADYVHSREAQANDRVFERLENHELDVIVQARMLGEGFDHPFLAVAMVGSIFANLGPFVQFVGRIMRAIEQNRPRHPKNQGVVVFHVGANVARRWNDFRQFSEADQEFFADLLPEAEEVQFFDGDAADRVPGGGGRIEPVEILEERDVRAADLDPIGDPQAAALLEQLANLGVTPDQAAQEIRRIRMTRQDRREARRAALNDRVQNESGGILGRCGIKPGGRTLDPRKRERNFAWVASELHRRLNEHVGGASADRQNFTLDQLNAAHDACPDVVAALERELRDGEA